MVFNKRQGPLFLYKVTYVPRRTCAVQLYRVMTHQSFFFILTCLNVQLKEKLDVGKSNVPGNVPLTLRLYMLDNNIQYDSTKIVLVQMNRITKLTLIIIIIIMITIIIIIIIIRPKKKIVCLSFPRA